MSATRPLPGLVIAPSATRAIAVEPMTIEDISAVIEIERASFPRPWPEKAYRYELAENPNAYFVVARASVANDALASTSSPWRRLAHRLHLGPAPYAARFASIVGFAGMWMYVDEAHIATIATHPQHRGHGIGELILLDLLQEAQRRFASSVTLEVRVGNMVAQNLYRKYGFEEVGRRKGYYQDNREDALLMTITHFTEPEYELHLDALARGVHGQR